MKFTSFIVLIAIPSSITISTERQIEDDESYSFLGFASWSEWSKCSKTCGHGVEYALRRCLDLRCSGPSSRYRVCSGTQTGHQPFTTYSQTKICPTGQSDAEVACNRAGAQLQARWHFVAWKASQEVDSCTVHCKASSNHAVPQIQAQADDGAECRRSDGRNGTCLGGRCLPVGCDSIIGSSLVFDQCGICGGDGKACTKKLFAWRQTGQFSSCNRTCGSDARQVSISVCINVATDRIVPERLCADQVRPRPEIRNCSVVCATKYRYGPWSKCSCEGTQTRPVFCVETSDSASSTSKERKVEDQYCWNVRKPETTRRCVSSECPKPKWKTGKFGSCSAKCGRGIRRRLVECRQNGRRLGNSFCDSEAKPPVVEHCSTEIACYKNKDGIDSNNSESSNFSSTSDTTYRFAEGSSFSHWSSEGFGHDSTSSVGFAAKDYFSNGDSSIKSKPRFVPGQWSDCSKTCGSGGIRTRIVHCVGTGVTGERVDLPAFECDGQQRPTLFQPCDLAPCTKNDFKIGVTKSKGGSNSQYRWEYGDWGPCSVGDQEVQCLGGKQKSTLKCVDIVQNIAVPWSNCRSKPRPVDLTRACNLKPCAPQWSASQWSECSHSCGGGSRSRNVRCIQRIAPETATDSQLILPDAQCAEQKPTETEACGVVDCEVNWRIGQWTSCSTSCGPGEQRREIVCEQRDRNGMLRTFNPPIQCLGLPRPPTLQLCNLGVCEYNEPNFHYETSNTIGERALPEPLAQLSDRSATDDNRVRSRFDSPSTVYESRPEHRKLTLNIGGSANLYEGTSIKVKCPVRNFARNRITWTKNGRQIENNAHIKVSSNGALRIFHARQEDAGTYECPAGSVRLRFKPREIGKSEIKDNLETTHELDDVDEPTSANDVDAQLLQKIRESLIRLGERRALDEMRDIREPGKLKVDFLSGDWSLCTQTRCGEPDGTQIRLLRCRILIKQTTAFVDDEICEQFGIVRPPATQTCHANGCPHWEATDWTECSISRCMQQGLSVARREIRCQYSNGTMADFSLCDRRTRPKIKKESNSLALINNRECPNVNCTAEWKASIWGKCSKDCGDGGVQMRLLRCVWRGTKKPAGGNCEPSLRPAAIKSCSIPDLPECSSESKLWPMDSQSNDSISRLEEQKDERPTELPQQTPPRDLAVQPFNNWQQWRGWRQYNLALPSNLRRLNTMKKL